MRKSDIRKLANVVKGMKATNYDKIECKICTVGKVFQLTNRSSGKRATASLEFVPCDLVGPIDPVRQNSFICFVIC